MDGSCGHQQFLADKSEAIHPPALEAQEGPALCLLRDLSTTRQENSTFSRVRFQEQEYVYLRASKGPPKSAGFLVEYSEIFLFNLTRIAVLRMTTKDLSGNLQGQNNSVIIFRYYFPFIGVSASTMMVQEH